MKLKTTLSLLALSLAACSTINPPPDRSTLERINAELRGAATPGQPAPAARTDAVPDALTSSLLPPLRMQVPRTSARQLEQRFDLVVTDAPIEHVLSGIVSGTPYSILMRPKSPVSQPAGVPAAPALPERMTLNLKDVTLFEALDAIREVYGYDYTVEGRRIYVMPPELQTRLYQVNYIIGQRRGVSDLQVISGASVGSSSSDSGSTSSSSGTEGSGSSKYASVQASALSTVAKSDFWGEVEDSLRTALGCQIPKTTAGQSTGTKSDSGSATRADVSFQDDTRPGERARGVDGCTDNRALTVNPMSGTILVRAMPRELATIGKMLRSMQLNIERQVIIEAKIIDVELNSESQQGVNWAVFNNNLHRFSVGTDVSAIGAVNPATGGSYGGTISSDATLGSLLGSNMVGTAAGSAFSAGLGMAVQFRNFSALLNFLQTQGTVHVLSSPRIATLNNQKAVIKVGNEEPYVTSISGGTTTPGTGGSATIVTPPSLNYQPFFSGIALDVTPQIDDRDNITLHVHSMVNNVVEKLKISQPSTSATYVPFAINTISEADSVVRTRDGQVVVIGGLMTETSRDDRNKVPGVGDIPVAGGLFSKGMQQSSKRELVILLKPTIVKDDGAWNTDIAAVQGRIEAIGNSAPPGVSR